MRRDAVWTAEISAPSDVLETRLFVASFVSLVLCCASTLFEISITRSACCKVSRMVNHESGFSVAPSAMPRLIKARKHNRLRVVIDGLSCSIDRRGVPKPGRWSVSLDGSEAVSKGASAMEVDRDCILLDIFGAEAATLPAGTAAFANVVSIASRGV